MVFLESVSMPSPSRNRQPSRGFMQVLNARDVCDPHRLPQIVICNLHVIKDAIRQSHVKPVQS